MQPLEELVEQFMHACREEYRLSSNTLRAYTCDLRQYDAWIENRDYISPATIRNYLSYLNGKHSPATVKRKLATLHAFMSFLQEKGHIADSPFKGIRIRIKTPQRLPKIIPTQTLRQLFTSLYDTDLERSNDSYLLRDRAIFELLIATGIRVSELCALNTNDIDLEGKTLRISGKGNKERTIQIENTMTLLALKKVHWSYKTHLSKHSYFPKLGWCQNLHKNCTRNYQSKNTRSWHNAKNNPTHVSPYFRNDASGKRYRHPLHTKTTRPQLITDNRNIHACQFSKTP